MASDRESLTCREFVDFIASYLDGSLPSDEDAEFRVHMGDCPTCEVYVNTYRETIRLGKLACAADDAPVPADVPEALVQAILAARRGKTR